MDLGGDWKRPDDPNASGGNVFDIGTGVAISFFVKTQRHAKGIPGCRIRYGSVAKFALSGREKLAWLGVGSISRLAFDEIRPDSRGTWLNHSVNDFEELMPVVSKQAKAAKRAKDERAVFRLFTLGVVTNRDDWVYGAMREDVQTKVRHLIDVYNRQRATHATRTAVPGSEIKWTRAVKRDLVNNVPYEYDDVGVTVLANYRPFVQRWLYSSRKLNEMVYRTPEIFGDGSVSSRCIVVSDPTAQKPWMTLAVDRIPDLHFVGAAAGSLCFAAFAMNDCGNRVDNITDWALDEFMKHYQPGPAKKAKPLTKEGIFYYVYAVLHDPLYREKYAQNLKREFPRIPFYGDSGATFWQWADWGEALMALHIGYESAPPFALARTDQRDEKARAAGLNPKPMLKADKEAGRIVLDSETTLSGIPPEAWRYQLGNRCALEWVLDQYKEKKPKDPTIREKFDTYRFADYKEKVIDLLARVTTVSVETVRIVDGMKSALR